MEIFSEMAGFERVEQVLRDGSPFGPSSKPKGFGPVDFSNSGPSFLEE